MPNFESTYIAKDTEIDNVIEIFGGLLHQLNYLMKNLDSENVKRINTNSTVIKSEDGTTEINGSQLVMYDGNGVQRAVLGYNKKTKQFVFTLSNANGNPTLALTSNGNATFSGTVKSSSIEGGSITGAEINVDTDLRVGNNIYIAPGKTGSTTKEIHFFDDGTSSVLKEGLITATKGNDGLVTMVITAGKIKFNTQSNIDAKVLLGNYRVVTTNMQSVKIDGEQHTISWD